MKLFLRLLVALVALFLAGTGPAHAYSHRQLVPPSPEAAFDFHARLASKQSLQELSFRSAPAQNENKLVRLIATDDNDEDEDENSAPSGKTLLAAPCSVECTFVPQPAFDGHPVARAAFSPKPLAPFATRRFIRLRVIRV